MVLLDTNVAIHLRDGDERTIARYARIPDEVAISLVTVIELEGGVAVNPTCTAVRRDGLDSLLLKIRAAAR